MNFHSVVCSSGVVVVLIIIIKQYNTQYDFLLQSVCTVKYYLFSCSDHRITCIPLMGGSW